MKRAHAGITLTVFIAIGAMWYSACGEGKSVENDGSTGRPMSATPEHIDDSSTPENPYSSLRGMALNVTADELGQQPSANFPVWGLIMDAGVSGGTYTLVVLRDDAVSLYLSTGGGFIGAGEHESVRARAVTLLDAAGDVLGQFQPAVDSALPGDGNVRFFLRTFDGTRMVELDERTLSGGSHPLSVLFFAAHDVITAVREASEP